MLNFFRKEDKTPEENYEGMIDNIGFKILESFGFSRDHIQKIKTIIESVDVKEVDDQTEITINLKKVVIRIEK